MTGCQRCDDIQQNEQNIDIPIYKLIFLYTMNPVGTKLQFL